MKVVRPKSVDEALRLYAKEPFSVPLAGGTDFMVGWNLGLFNGKIVLDLSRLKEWSGIRFMNNRVVIGALTTHATLRDHKEIKDRLPLVSQACATVGGPAIQNRGTIGGNLANASPAGDTFPPLLVYEAVVRTVSTRGKRSIPLSTFFAGVKKTALIPGELIEAVEVPVPPGKPKMLFRKVGTRAASAISKTVAAGLLWKEKNIVQELRFALGSMAPTARRLTAAETYLSGKPLEPEIVLEAASRVKADVAPIDDIRSTAAYRLRTAENLLKSFLEA